MNAFPKLGTPALLIVMTVMSLVSCSPLPQDDWLSVNLQLQPAVQIQGQSIRPTLDERMRRYGISAVSMALIEDGLITSIEVIGTVSVDTSDQIDASTLFQAASISKAVTAIGILVLADRGTIDIDRPANEYLLDWKISGTASTPDDPVTIKELLSHSGGINVPSYPGFERGADMPTLDDILVGAPNAYSIAVLADSVQGSYRYSGGGYMVLQKLIEDVTGEEFATFMRAQVFDRVGAPLSTFVVMNSPDGLAFGHDWRGEVLADRWQDYPQSAAAGLWTSPEEIAQLVAAYGSAYRASDETLLSQSSARRLATPIAGDMGLGFGVHGDGANLSLSHSGWTIGYRSHVLYYPESGAGVVIMTNGQAGHHLIDELLRTLALKQGWPRNQNTEIVNAIKLSGSELENLTGPYNVEPAGFELRVKRKGEWLEFTTERGSVYLAVPVAPDEFVLLETGDRVTVDSEKSQLQLWGMTAYQKI
jgi:CubicO group peptidase (beta-lactamase class C family)